ncbi:MAG: hypothetical protein JNL32_12735 [Candidatus Kapabacteria bacterium]|nr:hypothetical protein [Candidatus Kapabacteria bacterium]
MKRKTQGVTFKNVVETTPDIASGYKPGLTALGANSSKVKVVNNSLIKGSVDIDTCTAHTYPNAHRWDYVIGYKSSVIFVEVHSAHTSEVSRVLDKLKWLKQWLNSSAPDLKKLADTKQPYVWIQSKDFKILRTSIQYRQAAENGILPRANLILD